MQFLLNTCTAKTRAKCRKVWLMLHLTWQLNFADPIELVKRHVDTHFLCQV